MSEYQYHEWQTVDRVLTPAEQAEVDSLSSHIEVSSSQSSGHFAAHIGVLIVEVFPADDVSN